MKLRNTHLGYVLAGSCALWLLATPSRADTTDDLLNTLRQKGILSQQEYDALKARNAQQQQAPAAPAAGAGSFVTMMDKGVGLHIGPVDLSVSGEINAFYVQDFADHGGPAITGGLASTGTNNSSSIRSGLLPGDFNIKLSTHQEGYDIGVTFGFYPGLNSVTNVGGANSAGNPSALGTSGIDFRQQFITVGNDIMGTVKAGRDIGLFGQEAILNDFTLLGVGTPAGNAAPSNTSLGRIGLGYVYTDFIPQITYTSPNFAGFQGAIGVFTPLDATSFTGGTLTQHDQPQLQAKINYTVPEGMTGPFKLKLWSNFVTQNFQSAGPAAGDALPAGSGTRGWGVDYGGKADWGPLGLVAYGYNGDGLGTTGLFLGAISPTGQTRDSHGYYFQLTYTLFDRLTLGASYGLSHLDLAAGDVGAAAAALVKNNESEVIGAHYKLTNWVNLVGEYIHTHSESHGIGSVSSDALAVGSILFF